MEKPVFIQLLEYGEVLGLDGTNQKKTIEWAEENDIIPPKGTDDHDRKMNLLNNLFIESFSKSTNDNWVLKAEYYFRLLEYRELTEARKTAKQANRNAIWAIGISMIALIATVSIGYFQSSSPIRINNEQFTKIIEQINNTHQITLKEKS